MVKPSMGQILFALVGDFSGDVLRGISWDESKAILEKHLACAKAEIVAKSRRGQKEAVGGFCLSDGINIGRGA